MAEGNAQLRVARADAAGDHRGAGEADIARKAHRLLGEFADDAVLARGAQRVHEDRGALPFRRAEEWLKPSIANGNAIHMARDLDAGEFQALAVLELADRGVH